MKGVPLLTDEMLAELCRVHREGRDFRNVTATRCGLHPHLLTKWLKRGALSEEDGLYSKLLVAFGEIEGESRAELIREVCDPEVSRETITTDDNGKEQRVIIKRSSLGPQWFMSKRYRQYQEKRENENTGDESDVVDLLVTMAAQLPPGSSRHIIAQLASAMPDDLRLRFEQWAYAALPQGQTDGAT